MLPINGKPMIVNAIEKAIKANIFDEICVSTEDEEIAKISTLSGASVPFIRPEHLSKDPSTIIDVMLHTLEHYQSQDKKYDNICVLLPTAPFVLVKDICTAYEVFNQHQGNALLSVSPTEYPPFNAWITVKKDELTLLEPCFPESPYKYIKSTECPATYRSNGAILIVGIDAFLKQRTYRSLPMVPYIMPAERSLDIDTHFEYEFAKYLANTNFLDR
jgi:CMP-N-acetylneuraminic acid synthetase